MIVCINGDFVPATDAKISVFDHGLLYGDGVFETIAAVGGRIFWLEEHIDRLMASCRIIRLGIPWSREELSSLTAQTFERNQKDSGRLRINITRGIGGIPIDESLTCKPNLIIFSTTLDSYPRRYYENGIKMLLVENGRPYAAAKSLSFEPSVIAYLSAAENGCDEALFLDPRGNVLEGSASNLFIVTNGAIKTPRQGILLGVTRNKVIDLAERLGIAVEEADVRLGELEQADEAFLTGTTKKIVPAVQVGQTMIGGGTPGIVTRRLMDAFATTYF
jgi:branched-chain amino acid aminotransferase